MADRGLVLDLNGPESPPYDFVGVLSSVEDLARSFPSLSIVVNHCGGLVGPTTFPPSKSGTEALEGWKRLVGDLGRCPNVNMKLGGLVMPIHGHGLEHRGKPAGSEEVAGLMAPYIKHCLDCFGPQRCMFESNFPMDKCSVSYATYWNAYKRVVDTYGLSADEKEAAFAGTAIRV